MRRVEERHPRAAAGEDVRRPRARRSRADDRDIHRRYISALSSRASEVVQSAAQPALSEPDDLQ